MPEVSIVFAISVQHSGRSPKSIVTLNAVRKCKRGITSLSKSFATSVVFSVLVGYETHPEKMSKETNKNLKFPLVLGICVKSTCQSSNWHSPLYFFNYFIVVQLQLSVFTSHDSPQPQQNAPPSLASTPTLVLSMCLYSCS